MSRAATIDELEPLTALCRAGKLFDVQEWIQQGKPVGLPLETKGSGGKRNPLRIAMEKGFHSLVQVLLEAGAPVCHGYYNALDHAVELRRPDLAALLIQHGAKVGDVSMRFVIEMWHPEMIELFLSNGASLTEDNPIAWGFVYKIRPTLGLLKRFVGENPALMKQANLALRFHAGEGNPKWVALLLWAGADPWAWGPDRIEEADAEGDENDFSSAVELAVSRGKLEVLALKKLLPASDAGRPEAMRLLRDTCFAPSSEVLSLLLDRGFSPALLPDHGSEAIRSMINTMSWDLSIERLSGLRDSRSPPGIDSDHARERMKMLHMLVAHGAKWLPEDKHAIADVRKCLSKMKPDYVLEFLWLMKTYGAARRSDVQELLRTPTMARLLGQEREHASCLVDEIPEEPSKVEEGKRSDRTSPVHRP
jgi:hypothetical protein